MWERIDPDTVIRRRQADLAVVQEKVAAIVRDVREGGDQALLDLAEKFDRVRPDSLLVTEEEREAAYDAVEPRLVENLVEAEGRISWFHERQRPRDLWLEEAGPGLMIGMKTSPLDRVGAYIPGGRAAYPSTALMCTVPARVAGVPSICACSPPPIHPLTIVALDIGGANEIVRAGGAQAVAAMAYGTESVRPVNKIVGPGNVYVTAAKIHVAGDVAIDFPAGPSEIVVIADESARPEFIASDILAQAEHDPLASCLLLTPSGRLAAEVGERVREQAAGADRASIIAAVLSRSGYVICADLKEAVAIANQVGPEHLSLQVSDTMSLLPAIRHAGAVFLGSYSPVAAGDYASGSNHVLPTAGYARVASGLDVSHFLTRIPVQNLTAEGLEEIADLVEALATAEGLTAHAGSVRIRRKRTGD